MKICFCIQLIYILSFRFVLVGGIGYANGRYMAYVKRACGWETHNDLVRKTKRNSLTTKIHPHVLMYVKL